MDIRKVDALELLQSLGDKSVDLILTDPPYYKLLNIAWDKQWKTKDDYLNWLEAIVKECQRVLKDNGSFYMFCSPQMLVKVGGVIDKYFHILNTIRWGDKASCARSFGSRESWRCYLNNSEEIIFAEQLVQSKDGIQDNVFEPIRQYLNVERIRSGLSPKQCNEICGNQMAGHYFTKSQWELPTEANYNKLKQYMGLKPYGELKAQYDTLRRTFKLTADKAYNNTWNFKQTPSRQGRHPCEKPAELISHIIDVSSNEGDLVVDMFCGSCVVPKCCGKMNRRCVAGDVDDTYFSDVQ